MPNPLTEEDVFADDKDPLEAIAELRKTENSAIEDTVISEIPEVVEPVIEEVFTAEETVFDDDQVIIPEDELPKSDEITADPESSLPDEIVPGTKTTRTFKANGQEFKFTDDEILEQFQTVFGQSMDYTKKLQQIAPYRKMISALESEGITEYNLNIALDALKGDKGAIQELMKLNKLESFDLTYTDEESDYTPTVYGKDEGQLAIEEVTSKIVDDPEYNTTVDIVDNQWDQQSRQALSNNPDMIQGLHNDVKSGVYQQVAPEATKLAMLDGNKKSNLEYYLQAGAELQVQNNAIKSVKTVAEMNKPATDAEAQFNQATSEANKKRAATSTGARGDRKSVVDYLDDNDEAYDAWRKNLEASI